jgi:hypothetical protein
MGFSSPFSVVRILPCHLLLVILQDFDDDREVALVVH